MFDINAPMMLLTKDTLRTLINDLIKKGRPVIGPSGEGKDSCYKPLSSFEDINLVVPFPTKSSKEFFLADSEHILSYTFEDGNKINIQGPLEPKEAVLFGLRPCEAASYPIMDKVFGWDYKDEFYLKRREKNIIITAACDSCDEFCFCTSVNISPKTTEGSDIQLTRTTDGNYGVNVITPKGRALASQYDKLFTSRDETVIDFKGPAQKKFDISRIKPWLEQNFEHPLWQKIALPCIGCGVCTYLCPTCHCFDIVDEGNLKCGSRCKNWDACQFAMFTVHASGHNPRDTQSKRFRQRIQHKFNYYPDKFERTLCVGCGRCIRHCPTDMSLLNTLITIDKLTTKTQSTQSDHCHPESASGGRRVS